MKANLLKQLVREFWLPFSVALVWTLFSFRNGEPSFSGDAITAFIGVFAPAFFIMSWMTGQFFRVKKHRTVEMGLDGVRSKIVDLVERLDQKTKYLVNYLTGGESYCEVQIDSVRVKGNLARFWITHRGEYPIYDLQVRIVDIEVFDRIIKGEVRGNLNASDTVVDVGTLNSGFARPVAEFDLAESAEKKYSVIFTARNGKFDARVVLTKIDGVWISRIKGMREGAVLYDTESRDVPDEALRSRL